MTFPIPSLERYDRFAIDFETDGLGTTNVPVGVAVAVPGPSGTFRDAQAWYARWGHEGGANNCTLEEARAWSRVELTRPGQRKYAHFAAFDVNMAAHARLANLDRDHHALGRVECTLTMACLLNELERSFALDDLGLKYTGVGKTGDDELWAYCAEHFGGAATRSSQAKNIWRAPGDIVEPYAVGDVISTGLLGDTLRPKIAAEDLTDVFELETVVLPVLIKMHEVGVRVSLDRCHVLQQQMTTEVSELESWWEELTGGTISMTSTPQLAPFFESLGLPVGQTDLGNPSLTKDFLALIDHEVPRKILRHRHLKKFIGTYVDAYLNVADADGLMRCWWWPVKGPRGGTVSGRFSSAEPNLQNVPARDEVLAPMVRGLFIPYYDSMKWAKLDFSQIEYRFLAHYAAIFGRPRLAQAYADDPNVDFHMQCAQLIEPFMGVMDRKPVKNLNFCVVYGGGVGKVASMLGITEDEASAFKNDYGAALPEVSGTFKDIVRVAERRGVIRTWGGRKQRFKRKNRRFERTYKALNSLLQGSAADLIKMAMVRVDEVIDWDTVLLHLTVHDELDFSFEPSDDGWRMLREAKAAMEDFDLTSRLKNVGTVVPRVPVIADMKVGDDWGHTVAPEVA